MSLYIVCSDSDQSDLAETFDHYAAAENRVQELYREEPEGADFFITDADEANAATLRLAMNAAIDEMQRLCQRHDNRSKICDLAAVIIELDDLLSHETVAEAAR